VSSLRADGKPRGIGERTGGGSKRKGKRRAGGTFQLKRGGGGDWKLCVRHLPASEDEKCGKKKIPRGRGKLDKKTKKKNSLLNNFS